MKLSAPVYRLRREAKLMSRRENVPLHEALDRIATKEGFGRWDLLVARAAAVSPAIGLFKQLNIGDLLLVGARPGHGKTLMSLELAVAAMKAGHCSMFFSLEYRWQDVLDRFRAIGADPAGFRDQFEFDNSDEICADYIVQRLASAPRGTLVVIDYLQLLDQKRRNPELTVQITALKLFARKQGLILVFVSQVDRSYDPAVKPCPGMEDVRLPNPLDLSLFNHHCFMHDGQMRFGAT